MQIALADAVNGDDESQKLSPIELNYSQYIQGELLFPSRVDLSDFNVTSRKKESELAATIRKLAGIEHILSGLNSNCDPTAAKSTQITTRNDR